jgi:gliding motility-associated-like protein
MKRKIACVLSVCFCLLAFSAIAQKEALDKRDGFRRATNMRARWQNSVTFLADGNQSLLSGERRLGYLSEQEVDESAGRLENLTTTASGNVPVHNLQGCDPGNNLLYNGGFETGSRQAWNVRYGYRDSIKGKIKWNKRSDQPPPTIITASSPLLPQQGKQIDPYCGTYMLRLNDLVGDYHVTEVKRTMILGDVGPCSRIQITWGAMLEEATNHSAARSAQFRIDIKRKRWWEKRKKSVYSYSVNAREGAAGGWEDIRSPGWKNPIWYKTETFTHDMSSFEKGDLLEFVLTVMDCNDGAHGGAAFLDCAGVIDPCTGNCPGPNQSPIPDPIIPNIFTPNNDGINDEWSLPSVYGACQINAEIRNRWGKRVAWRQISNPLGYTGETVSIWDGRKINSKGKRLGPASASGSPYYYILNLKNCVETKDYTGYVYFTRCLGTEVISDEVEAKLKLAARAEAVNDWREKVRADYPDVYDHWMRAGAKRIDCEKRGSKWFNKKWYCVATGRPCRK